MPPNINTLQIPQKYNHPETQTNLSKTNQKDRFNQAKLLAPKIIHPTASKALQSRELK